MGNDQSNQSDTKLHALPLIRIVNNKMDIVAAVPKIDLSKTKVVSILGKARMGKSTFLNTIVSKISGENKNIFETKDDLDHCTRGIDYYYLANENILLLDSQGLAHEDSRHDPALLLFVYLVSDIIVFNERMMLQNEALSLLQPICTFMNYVDLEDIQKPTLIFRISDGDMVKDTEKNLEKLLTSYPDQYQSIRESIGILFEKGIHVVRTRTVDSVARDSLELNDYTSLLAHKSMGFDLAIDQILQIVRTRALQKNPYFKNIKEIVEKINNNEKIKVEKLDIVGLTARNEIQDWILAIDNSIYSPIEVDGTQKCYEEKVEARKNQKKQLLKSFTLRFKTFPLTIREPYYTDLQKKLEEPIRIATEESISKAKARVLGYATAAINKKTIRIDSAISSFTKIEDSSVPNYFPEIVALTNSIEDIYEPVKEEYEEKIKKVYSAFRKALHNIKEEEKKEYDLVWNTCYDAEQSFRDWLLSEIEKLQIIDSRSFIFFDNKEIILHFVEKKKKEISSLALKTIRKRELEFIVSNIEPLYIVNPLDKPVSQKTIDYDLIYDTYRRFEDFITRFLTYPNEDHTKVLGCLIEKKEKYLHGYLLPEDHNTRIIVAKNKDCVEFIRFRGSFLTSIFTSNIMTRQTYNTYYKPMMSDTFKTLIKSGYAKKSNNTDLITNIGPTSILYTDIQVDSELTISGDNSYTSALADIFIHKLKKTYCREVVKGLSLPKLWEHSNL